ncbi:MAG: bifunctional phosphoribosylaminoimidazolecarboxamide formyltransferase/IMP cyclohydrolase [Chloroflexota bacterium]|nr:bifunctional phosphoribosylaminoimidazolecarboxamide formyltransferase/IMP cyclohydrolase [Chloroflexota bacterium]
MRAILSVSDKAGIEDAARRLAGFGVEIFSTGGTLAALQGAGVAASSVTDLTDFPEIMEGRVKTLHPGLHGGILARRSEPSDLEQIAQLGIQPIDVVIVNLYPFARAIESPEATIGTALDNIDIGGPTLIRAAAKNFEDVLVLTDPVDYDMVFGEWSEHGAVSLQTRQWLAAKGFGHVSAYDALISSYLRGGEELFPSTFTVAIEKIQDLRYGENPHQRGALYREVGRGPGGLASSLRQLGGKDLSFNNILDVELGVATVSDFKGPTVAIIKHGNPCGLATNSDLTLAFEHALMGDPVSAFGGVVAVNRPVTEALAGVMSQTFFEVVVAPDFDERGQRALTRRKNLRVLEVGPMLHSWELPTGTATLDWKRVSGGFLVQTPDAIAPDEVETRLVAGPQPTLDETTDLLFAWRVAEHVRSNAIVLAKNLALVGMGAGQPSRVDSVRLAVQKADLRAQGSVLASDAFFPFADGIEEAAKAGVSAIIQPGGSIRDDEVIAAADRHGISMVFTGARHFRH